MEISVPDRLYHTVNIRMLLQGIRMKIFINKLRGNADIRLGNQNIGMGRCRKRCQNLSDPLRKCRSSHNAVGNICAQLYRKLLHLLPAHGKLPEFIQSMKNGCRIGTSTCHSGCNRNIFLQGNLYPTVNSIFSADTLCCLINEIILRILRQKRIVVRYKNNFFSSGFFKT